ncbi:protein of unknown function [Bradyrhizobium vignae]|uniref:Uncharacterized protein n=1 Tax=Bradyrhizobium vignae TaxID=1549949 RepID=A0A2U3PUV6_9BRAD|nr:protein of unknown function [Bradyrhizobium vignae]
MAGEAGRPEPNENPPVALPPLEYDAGIHAAKPKTIRYRVIHHHLPGLWSDEINALRGIVGIFQVQGGRGYLVS